MTAGGVSSGESMDSVSGAADAEVAPSSRSNSQGWRSSRTCSLTRAPAMSSSTDESSDASNASSSATQSLSSSRHVGDCTADHGSASASASGRLSTAGT